MGGCQDRELHDVVSQLSDEFLATLCVSFCIKPTTTRKGVFDTCMRPCQVGGQVDMWLEVGEYLLDCLKANGDVLPLVLAYDPAKAHMLLQRAGCGLVPGSAFEEYPCFVCV